MSRGIVGRELQQLLGHSSHETGRWQHMSELGNDRYFRRYDPPSSLGKSLGNIRTGDGKRYRGRGHLMLTGRENYRNAGLALELPLEEDPDLMLDPYISAMVTVWWWQDRVQPRIKNWNSTVAIANIINPGNTDQRAMNSRHRKVYEQGLELGLVARR
jgi:putative chitinase